ncbi:N-acetylmuramoyl-L-alanine amidase [Rhodohalobacter sp. 8-1]|uniref:N-acetylmuramoyl-L-alanine amidase n=1 Tax=Rhodohalobacter sp. 8-1 TaxID=3131972 RepID=UPI0030EB7173
MKLFQNILLKKLSLSALLIVSFLIFQAAPSAAQDPEITGFDGWSVVIDPGHSQTENMGIYNFSEAEKVLTIALHLEEMLLTKTDISDVYLTRDNGTDIVSLTQRTDFANSVAADFYHSVHSDAGPPSANSTLFLWGGWLNYQNQIVEKTPTGGQAMGDIMNVDLPSAMRIGTRGTFADRTFYQNGAGNQYPYLFVNRTSNMASILSEGGFHTNPEQNQLNMNEDYLRIEAQSHFWSYMKYLSIDRVEIGILSGVINDQETGKPINGATVTANGNTYITDTYESVFNQYSNDPEQLSNGFYYFSGLTPNSELTLTVDAENYFSETVTVSVNAYDFTFADVELLSSLAPVVDSLYYNPEEGLMPGENLLVEFNRAMNRQTVEDAIVMSPDVEYTVSWQNDQIIRIRTGNFDYLTEYTLTINDTALDQFDNMLDGDADGEEGGTYSAVINTTGQDTDPPQLVTSYPINSGFNFFNEDIIQLVFNEPLNQDVINGLAVELSSSSTADPDFTAEYTELNDRGVIQLIPHTPLVAASSYDVVIPAGVEDKFGNATADEISISFLTSGNGIVNPRYIDSFNQGLTDWWEPQQSGSTSGIATEITGRPHETVDHLSQKGSSGAMRINYGWDEASAGPYLIRIYKGGGLRFNAGDEMLAYVFGDGSGTPMRFVIRDSNNQLEASDWIDINWIGWRLVRWEMTEETSNAWVNGDGNLDGELFIDSIQLSYNEGQSELQGSIIVDELKVAQVELLTSNEDEITSNLPTSYELSQNYPNPFNPSTVLSYSLPESSEVSLSVYNLTGQLIATIDEGTRQAGTHNINFDAGHLSSGVYIYRLSAGNTVLTKKMTLIK